jgi:hypothetical protein
MKLQRASAGVQPRAQKIQPTHSDGVCHEDERSYKELARTISENGKIREKRSWPHNPGNKANNEAQPLATIFTVSPQTPTKKKEPAYMMPYLSMRNIS